MIKKNEEEKISISKDMQYKDDSCCLKEVKTIEHMKAKAGLRRKLSLPNFL